jgi:cob(I)alamin adenosyltransferase
MKQGLVHIYTGGGKGKTTAAVGLAVRALGQQLRVCYAYFHKDPEKYGYAEIGGLKKLGADIFGIAEGHPLFNKNIDKESHRLKTEEDFQALAERIKNEKPDMLVMDEVMGAISNGFMDEERLLEFINQKPENMELIMTGRGTTDRLIGKADYVSDITKIKHPFDRGITARKGIEY